MQSFDDLISGKQFVLVEFYATWCIPCKRMKPILQEITDELAGNVHLTRIDVDQEVELTKRFKITSVPTYLLFQSGEILLREDGMHSKPAFKEKIEKALMPAEASA